MGRDAVQETVEPTYRPTVQDFAQVLGERRRFSRAGRRGPSDPAGEDRLRAILDRHPTRV
ncbi:hypothetical protein FNH09_01105 [Streptomyces adustus]|uniref:Uncharacterized protein n=1 Tax=Streptomyces adustus TaxID=1609272 RepID=A0A5N8V459_9ACTN|nr:hypothetical protein [Streptomyces adustus]MPY29973.1 hypothetical protein [Streptomyces adustus]